MQRVILFYRKLFAVNKSWLKKTALLAVFWFGAGFATYFVSPESASWFLDFLERIFKDILGGRDLAIDFTSVFLIFRNNFQAALIGLFGGMIVGIIPFFSLAFNFFILGYLSGLLTGKAQGWLIFVITVVPHGIVEIPMFLLSAAFGLRLGFFWRIKEPISGWGKLKICLKDNLKLVPLLFLGFLLAAFLEIFVSGKLASSFLPLDGGG